MISSIYHSTAAGLIHKPERDWPALLIGERCACFLRVRPVSGPDPAVVVEGGGRAVRYIVVMTGSGVAMAAMIDVGTWGWDRVDWTADCYPQDLPADWKLSYYATRFETVLVPPVQQHELNAALVRQWHQEAGERFEFCVQCPEQVLRGGRAGLAQWLENWSCLGENLIGLIIDAGSPPGAGALVQQVSWLADRVQVYLDGVERSDAASAGLCRPGVYPVARSGTIAQCRNARVAIIDEAEYAQALRRLNGFIQDFLSQNIDHEILYLYVRPCGGSLAFVDQVRTLVDLITPENC